MIGIDATVLTLVLNDRADSPPDPATGKPVERVKERVDFWVQSLHKAKQKIIIPTPALSEVLVRAGLGGLRYVDLLQKSSVFDIRDFDKLAAVELALLTQAAMATVDKKAGSKDPWQKIKIDRQIVSICKVARVSTMYASDVSLANFAKAAGMNVIGVHELPLPPTSPQRTLEQWLAEQKTHESESKETGPDDTDEEDDEGGS